MSVEGAPMCRVLVPQWGEEGACMGGEPEQGGVGVPVVAGKQQPAQGITPKWEDTDRGRGHACRSQP